MTRWVILGVVGLVFALPIVAMIEFSLSTRSGDGYTLDHWTGLFDPENARAYRTLFTGIGNSLLLAVVTVGIVLVVLLPTMVLVHLRFPRLQARARVHLHHPDHGAGDRARRRTRAGVLDRREGARRPIWTLAFAYGITVLPYAYRAIQANLDAVPS